MKTIRSVMVLVAVIFGLLTVFAGTRVLLGADPGYIVYRPLLIYNTAMGFMYILAGITALRSLKQGMYASVTVFALNVLVLSTIYYLYKQGSPIAVDSLRAMTFRTMVWLVLLAGFAWLYTRNKNKTR